MNYKKTTALLCSLCLLLTTSCIRDEALNAEADIVSIDSAWVNSLIEKGTLIGNPRVENNMVQFLVRYGTDVTRMDPRFNLTPGATISPASGTELDFTNPQTYTVTPENQGKSKTYTVSFEYALAPVQYSFENFELQDNAYHRFYELNEEEGKLYYWASGNGGFKFAKQEALPDEYPTVSVEAGYRGRGVRLQTLSTGEFGERFSMPIAAGNLFIGEFNTNNAVLFPLKATRFGLPILEGKPVLLKGYYKYTAGEVYMDEKKTIHPELHDACDLYAVVYEINPKKFEPLNGEDIKTSQRIVLMAEVENPGEPQEWTRFEVPFREKNGKTFSQEKLANGEYAIALVFTSSIKGASFCGAVGSTLYIDEIELAYENNQE